MHNLFSTISDNRISTLICRLRILLPTVCLFICCMLNSSCADTTPINNHPRNLSANVSYKRYFRDLNRKHLRSAKSIGIKPLKTRKEAKSLSNKLIKIKTNENYLLDSLTHSIPYLVPEADRLLNDLGQNFLDSLKNKGLNPNRLIVTSVLRTEEDIKRLRKTNINASSESAHAYGTTFDISWCRFNKIDFDGKRPFQSVHKDTLKMVLAEVLRDLRKDDRCYIKYEVKQGCFHITARQQ